MNKITKITKIARWPGGLRLLATTKAYITRLLADSGLIVSKSKTNDLYKSLPAQDSIVFGWAGVAGSKKRTSTIWSYFTKLYSMFGTDDAVQTTESLQPYVSGNIAPNENKGLKNVNGDGRYMTHPEISFAADEAWSVTAVLNWNGSLDNTVEYCGDNSTANSRLLIKSGGTAHYFGFTNSLGGLGLFSSDFSLEYIGKDTIVTFVADGAENLSLYINGIFLSTKTVITSFILNALFAGKITDSFEGVIPAHLIRNIALTAPEVLEEATLLQKYYPEIPSVDIGTQTWASSNMESVATNLGNVIPEEQDGTAWAALTTEAWCYHNNDLATGAIYGKEYNGYARTKFKTDIATAGDWGWHISTEAELTALALNGGYSLKVGGTDYWNTTGGTNSTGFTALGGGVRNSDGTFGTIKNITAFWCGDSDKVLVLNHDDNTATITVVDNKYGAYIRLVED